MINYASMSSNAASRSNEVQLNVLKAQMTRLSSQARSNQRGSSSTVVDGHFVMRNDSQRNDKRLMKVCKDFESIFVNQLFKVMRKTLNPKNNIIHGGHAEEVFSDMLYQKYSKLVANKGDFGYAKTLYDHLTTINRGY